MKNGQILTPLELEKEKPIFMEAPLVETGCSYPFYDEYMAGLGSVVNQIMCADFHDCSSAATRSGDLHVLQSLWSQIGTVTNHQTLFSPYDWGSSRLAVSIISF